MPALLCVFLTVVVACGSKSSSDPIESAPAAPPTPGLTPAPTPAEVQTGSVDEPPSGIYPTDAGYLLIRDGAVTSNLFGKEWKGVAEFDGATLRLHGPEVPGSPIVCSAAIIDGELWVGVLSEHWPQRFEGRVCALAESKLSGHRILWDQQDGAFSVHGPKANLDLDVATLERGSEIIPILSGPPRKEVYEVLELAGSTVGRTISTDSPLGVFLEHGASISELEKNEHGPGYLRAGSVLIPPFAKRLGPVGMLPVANPGPMTGEWIEEGQLSIELSDLRGHASPRAQGFGSIGSGFRDAQALKKLAYQPGPDGVTHGSIWTVNHMAGHADFPHRFVLFALEGNRLAVRISSGGCHGADPGLPLTIYTRVSKP